jgi:hypothetical protein
MLRLDQNELSDFYDISPNCPTDWSQQTPPVDMTAMNRTPRRREEQQRLARQFHDDSQVIATPSLNTHTQPEHKVFKIEHVSSPFLT